MSYAASLKSVTQRLLRAPGYALALLATLTLGMSLTITMFAVVHGVAFAPLPYPDDEQIVVLESVRPRTGAQGGLTPRDAVETLPKLAGLQSFAYYSYGGADLLQGDRPRNLTLNTVGAQFFDVLRVAPMIGRALDADDLGKARTVLSHATWQSVFGGDPDVVGKTLKLNWITPEIVGVMPPSFEFPSSEVALWIAADPQDLTSLDAGVYNNARFLQGIARLRPDVSAIQFNATLQAQAIRPAGSDDWVLTSERMLDAAIGDRAELLLALLGIAALVLLIGCANAAHLVMVRGLDRLGKFAVMRALGASHRRIASEFLVEVVVITALALSLSLLISTVGMHAFVGLVDSGLPRASEISVTPTVVAFALVNAALVILVCGAWPTWRMYRSGIEGALRRRIGLEPGTATMERGLPVMAIALSLAALSTAALLAISAHRLGTQDQVATVDRMLAVQLFPGSREGAEVSDFLESVRMASAAIPGVEHAALMTGAPFTPVGSMRLDVTPTAQDQAESRTMQARAIAGPALEALGVRVLRGRALAADDRAGSTRVALLNERAARELFDGEDPIGRSVGVPPYGSSGELVQFEVVGIVEDRKLDRVDGTQARAEIWMPFMQYPVPFGSLLLTSSLPPKSLIKAAESAVWSVDATQGIYRTFAPADERDAQLAAPRFFARNAAAFAVFALALSMVGVYAVLAVDLSRRRRELALRAALGASRSDALRFVATKGMLIGIPGTLIGVALAAAMAQGVSSVLFDVSLATPWVVGGASLPLLLLTAIACWALARRIARVEPNLALREE
jgi:predicted permease